MKILYLIDNFSLGGAQTILKGLVENSLENHRCFAIALREKKPVISIENPNVISYPSSSRYSISALRFVKKFIIENGIDLIHCQLPRSIIYGYLLKRRFPSLKYIIHEQGDIFESSAYAFILRFIARKADRILTCSHATQQQMFLQSGINPEQIKVIYNFVDLDRFQPDSLSSEILKIGFAGRIEKRKGWREFISAAKSFKKNDKLSFLIAGTGTEQKSLIQILNGNEYTNVEFLGFIDRVENFYHDIDLLVIPSHFEPMGMVAIEAMACGVPVIASNVPGMNEVIEHNTTGWMYSNDSIENLVSALEVALNTSLKDINIMVTNGLSHASEFSVLKYIKQLNSMYSNLCDDKADYVKE